LPPSRQLVSSRCATRCASTSSRAAYTGSAITSVGVFSDWLIEPTLMGTPNRSAITLLCSPLGGGVFGVVEMHDAAPLVSQHNEPE
jgi:hypothetical protein